MSSIPVAICRFSGNNFKRFYQEEKTFYGLFIARRKDFLWIVYCFSQMCMKFRTFWKKTLTPDEYSTLIITVIIASERDIYLSV